MATQAEKQALLFLVAVVILGGGVRVWRLKSPPELSTTGQEMTTHPTPAKNTAKTGQRSAAAVGYQEHYTIDLDEASIAEIDDLGVLKPGIARMIVANRDSFGPFGSLTELERIPYMRKTVITALAPHVSFSRRPRPAAQRGMTAGGASRRPRTTSKRVVK